MIAKGPRRVLRLPIEGLAEEFGGMSDVILSLEKATKLYSGVPAIEDVDFGAVHAARFTPWWARTAPANRL